MGDWKHRKHDSSVLARDRLFDCRRVEEFIAAIEGQVSLLAGNRHQKSGTAVLSLILFAASVVDWNHVRAEMLLGDTAHSVCRQQSPGDIGKPPLPADGRLWVGRKSDWHFCSLTQEILTD